MFGLPTNTGYNDYQYTLANAPSLPYLPLPPLSHLFFLSTARGKINIISSDLF